MLKQRVLTALGLLALLLPSLMVDSRWPFALFALLLATAGMWEWARLSGVVGPRAVLAAIPVALVGIGLMQLPAVWSFGVWLSIGLAWLVLLAHSLRHGPEVWNRWPTPARLMLGWLVLTCTWAALVQGHALGVGFLLTLMATVWVSDIAAYFAGRRWGRRRLAARISPGKSWEGVWGAAVGVAIYAVLLVLLETSGRVPGLSISQPSLYMGLGLHRAPGSEGLPLWSMVMVVSAAWWLAALGICGDLFESLQKRATGVKDSSRLLPGHGGVLDRVDALLPMLPWAMALAVWSR